MTVKKQKSSFKGKDAISVDQEAVDYILTLVRNEKAAKNVAGAINVSMSRELKKHDVDAIIPPATPLHQVAEAFKKYSDLPLELPVHNFMFYLSTWLLHNKVTVKVPPVSGRGGQIITPEIWTICLAPSGAGKTYSSDRIKASAPIAPTIEGIKSGPAFFEAMLKNQQNGDVNSMFVDEVAQMIKEMEQPGSPLASLKEFLLNAYSKGPLKHTTVKGGDRVVNNSTMSFYGCNVSETFFNSVKLESFQDGFVQRYGFVIAKMDEDRHHSDFPAYNNILIEEEVAKAWDTVKSIPLLTEYEYAPEAVASYNAKFKELALLIEQKGVVNVSFFRRLLQRTHKLALIYHIILGKGDKKLIDAIDMAWAMRLTESHLIDVTEAILFKAGAAGDALRRTSDLGEKFKKEGKKLLPSSLTQNIRSVKDGAIPAKSLYDAYKNSQKKPQ